MPDKQQKCKKNLSGHILESNDCLTATSQRAHKDLQLIQRNIKK